MSDSKEVLHTQGEWKVNYDNPSFINIYSPMFGGIAQIPADRNHLQEHKANAELIVKAVNEREDMIMELQNTVSAYDEQLEINTELKANYQKLLDENEFQKNQIIALNTIIGGSVEKNHKLLDSNRELLAVINNIFNAGDGQLITVQTYIEEHPEIVTAINNAKNINK